MREPAFWWRPSGVAAALLAPLGAVYGAVAARRLLQPSHSIDIPVLCVGNLTLGGAGKTPTAIAVAELLGAEGCKPFLLSRGYGGSLGGPVQVDPAHHGAADVGDEPLLLARHAPTIVARDRVAGAAMARTAGAGSIVMDDGFQSPGLHKDRSILVVDGRRGIGNGLVFPAGPLRAPLARQIERADAMMVIGDGMAAEPAEAAARQQGMPVFHGHLEPDRQAVADLKGHALLAFAGIGDPEKFFATLRNAGLDVRACVAFPDHHRYRRAEAAELIDRARREGLVLVTTEKDQARLAGQDDLAALASVARPLPVRLRLDDAGAFKDLVLAKRR